MRKQTNENVTINDAMVKAISEAVTSALVQALVTIPETSTQVASAPETIEPETTTASPKSSTKKSSKGKGKDIDYSVCAGYIERKGEKVYIAYTDRNGNNIIAKLDSKGKPVVKNGKVETVYTKEAFNKAKKTVSARLKKAKKRVDIDEYRKMVYLESGIAIAGKVKSL